MKKIKTAIVGCGRISETHLNAIRQNSEHFDLVAICDTDEIVLESVSWSKSLSRYNDYDKLIASESLDLVALCTPSGLHPFQALNAFKNGINVLSEKPIGVNFKDGLTAVEAAEKANLKYYVMMQNRLNPPIRLLKQSLEKKRFGKIFLIVSNVYWFRPQEYYDHSPWRGTWAMDGGAFMNQASHYVDLISWLGGPVERVHSFTGTLARKIEAEDTGTLSIKYKHGAIGSINVTMLSYPKNLEGSMLIIGEKGTVKIGGNALNNVETWNFAEPDEEIDRQIKSASYETSSVYGFGHSAYYKEVAHDFIGHQSLVTSGREGLVSLQILCSCYKSALEGKEILND